MLDVFKREPAIRPVSRKQKSCCWNLLKKLKM